jgi:AcrR family transcriptional regulator
MPCRLGEMTTPPVPGPGQSRKPAGAAVLQPDKTDAIVAAFYDELAESGHEKLTMDRVAARAGVGKAALYRRWRSKEQMIAELVSAIGDDEDTPAPDLGSLRADLCAWFAEAVALGNDPVLRQVITYVVAMARSSPELVQLMRRVPGPGRDSARAILQHAIDRGELDPDTDLETAIDIITGVVWRQVLIASETLDVDFAKRVTAMVVRALGLNPAS